MPEIRIAAGKVRTHAISRLRIVDICSPDRFAAIVPATPEDSTWMGLADLFSEGSLAQANSAHCRIADAVGTGFDMAGEPGFESGVALDGHEEVVPAMAALE